MPLCLRCCITASSCSRISPFAERSCWLAAAMLFSSERRVLSLALIWALEWLRLSMVFVKVALLLDSAWTCRQGSA